MFRERPGLFDIIPCSIGLCRIYPIRDGGYAAASHKGRTAPDRHSVGGVSKHREQIIAAAAEGKVDGEILGAAFAKPRGATTEAATSGVAREIGAQWSGMHQKGAAGAGIKIGNPGAVAVTASSLVTMQVGVSMGGQVKEVKEILSTVPLSDVDSIEVKRFGLAGVMTITAGGSSFKLEGKVGDLREFADSFERAKASA